MFAIYYMMEATTGLQILATLWYDVYKNIAYLMTKSFYARNVISK